MTGNTNVVEWSDLARKLEHLRSIGFWRVDPRPIVDIPIGLDYVDLHYSYRDIRGNPGEPIARLTPLSWTLSVALMAEPFRRILEECVSLMVSQPQMKLHQYFTNFGNLNQVVFE